MGKNYPSGCIIPGQYNKNFVQLLGYNLHLFIRVINDTDTIIKLPSVKVLAMLSQRVKQIIDWEDIPVNATAIMRTRAFLQGVAGDRTKLLACH